MSTKPCRHCGGSGESMLLTSHAETVKCRKVGTSTDLEIPPGRAVFSDQLDPGHRDRLVREGKLVPAMQRPEVAERLAALQAELEEVTAAAERLPENKELAEQLGPVVAATKALKAKLAG